MTQPEAGTPQHPVRDTVLTTCGRHITIGLLRLDGLARPTTRVTLGIDCEPFDQAESWAALTPAEARTLAGRLLAQAAAAEGSTAAVPHKIPVEGDAPSGVSPGRVEVSHLSGDSYAVGVRTHVLLVDQPVEAGGGDTAVTPTELFVGSLASCVAFYAGRHLTRHGIGRNGLKVTADYTMATDRPARVRRVRLTIAVPAELPAARLPALLAVARRCTVHNTLVDPPQVSIELE